VTDSEDRAHAEKGALQGHSTKSSKTQLLTNKHGAVRNGGEQQSSKQGRVEGERWDCETNLAQRGLGVQHQTHHLIDATAEK
jgi:hypothetical protein